MCDFVSIILPFKGHLKHTQHSCRTLRHVPAIPTAGAEGGWHYGTNSDCSEKVRSLGPNPLLLCVCGDTKMSWRTLLILWYSRYLLK